MLDPSANTTLTLALSVMALALAMAKVFMMWEVPVLTELPLTELWKAAMDSPNMIAIIPITTRSSMIVKPFDFIGLWGIEGNGFVDLQDLDLPL